MRALLHLSVVSLACILGLPASAQLLNQKAIPAAMAMTMAQTALDTCKANGFSVSVTVVGRTGEILVQVRGDGAGPHTMENCVPQGLHVAHVPHLFGRMDQDVSPGRSDPRAAVHLTNVIALAGALPVKAGDEVIGAVGVSGAPGGDKDEVCVQAGLDKVADQLK